jgi:hypothetical protein
MGECLMLKVHHKNPKLLSILKNPPEAPWQPFTTLLHEKNIATPSSSSITVPKLLLFTHFLL